MTGPTGNQRLFGQQVAPTALGTVRGFRGWSVMQYVHRARITWEHGRMTAFQTPTEDVALVGRLCHAWTPGVNIAQCRSAALSALEDTHQLVGLDCTCGFYAYWCPAAKSPNEIATAADSQSVIGIIDGWGKTVIGDLGFRCENARIVAIAPGRWMPPTASLLAEIADKYDVPVYPDADALAEAYPTEGAPA